MIQTQLQKIEEDLAQTNTRTVEIFFKGLALNSIVGEYHRDQNCDLIRLTRGISTHWIDIESISAIGVRHNEYVQKYTE